MFIRALFLSCVFSLSVCFSLCLCTCLFPLAKHANIFAAFWCPWIWTQFAESFHAFVHSELCVKPFYYKSTISNCVYSTNNRFTVQLHIFNHLSMTYHRYNISSCPSIFACHLWFCEVKGMLLFVLNRECLKVQESYLTSKWIPSAKWKTSPTLAWVNTSTHYSYLETLKHVFTLVCLHGDWGVATVSSVLSISESERTFLPRCIIATLSNHSASYAL